MSEKHLLVVHQLLRGLEHNLNLITPLDFPLHQWRYDHTLSLLNSLLPASISLANVLEQSDFRILSISDQIENGTAFRGRG